MAGRRYTSINDIADYCATEYCCDCDCAVECKYVLGQTEDGGSAVDLIAHVMDESLLDMTLERFQELCLDHLEDEKGQGCADCKARSLCDAIDNLGLEDRESPDHLNRMPGW